MNAESDPIAVVKNEEKRRYEVRAEGQAGVERLREGPAEIVIAEASRGSEEL